MSTIEIRRRPIDVDDVNSSRFVPPRSGSFLHVYRSILLFIFFVIFAKNPKRQTTGEQLSNYCSTFINDIFPPIKWIRTYKKQYLPGDIISGLTVSMIRLPQVRDNLLLIPTYES